MEDKKSSLPPLEEIERWIIRLILLLATSVGGVKFIIFLLATN